MRKDSAHDQELKRVQETLLQHCDDLYVALAMTSPDAVTVTGTDLRIIMANMQAAKLHGFRIPEQMIGKNTLRFIAPADRRRAMENAKKIIKTGSIRNVEYTLLTNEGRRFIGEVSASVVLDDEYKPKAFICVTRDISKRKEAEKCLREQEEKFRLAFEHAKDAIFWADPASGTIINCNKAAELLLEKPKKEIIGQSQTSLHPANKAQHYLKLFEKHIKNKMAFDDEAEIATKSGTIKLVHITASVTYVGERTIIQGVFRDITDRKKAEAHIANIKKDWESTFEDIDETVIISDAELNVVRANKAAEHLFNMPLHKILKSKCYELFHEKNGPCVSSLCIVQQCMRVGKTISRELYEPSLKKFIEVKAIPCFDRNKNIIRVVHVIRDITPRKQAEAALKEREVKYKALVENVPGMIYRAGPDWSAEIISGSKAICGYSPEEINAMKYNWLSIIHPDDKKKIYTDGTALVKKQMAIVQVYRIIHKNGGTRWIEDHKTSLFSENGDFIGIDGMVLDITARKKAEERLQASERNYREIFNSANEAIFVYHPKSGTILDVNQAACEIYGYSYEELLKLKIEDISQGSAPYSQKQVQQWVKKAAREGPQLFEWLSKRKNGTLFWVEVNLKHAMIGDKDYILAVVHDITVRKRTEEALRRLDERFRQIAENAQVWIWEVDASGLFVYSSSLCEKILGYTPKEIVGEKHFYDLFLSEERKARTQETFNFFRKKEPFRALISRCKHKGGSVVWVSISGVPILNKKGDLIGYRGAYADITPHKKAEAELQAAKNQLQDQAWGLERTNKSVKLLSQELQNLNKELTKSNRKLRKMSLVDSQTGLFNHRYFEDMIEREFYRAERENEALSLIMIDLDYFKSINDTYGHKFGDLVLKQFTTIIKKVVRRYDITVRYGGEEFVVISPGADRSEALTLALRIFDSVRGSDFGNKKNKVRLKLSMSVVSYPEDKIIKSMDLIELADRILNKAKEDGANRIYFSHDLLSKESRVESLEEQAQEADVNFLKGKIVKLTKGANQGLIELVLAFAKALKLKDSYTGEHTENTVRYAIELAKAAGLSKEEIRDVRQAAILHDLGKIGISENILQKKARLTEEEFEEIKRHPQIAVDILRPIHFLHNLIPLIRHHHERWDGKGYPDGLKAEHIPLGARIVALADVYHALTSDRPYRKAFSKQKALQMIQEGAGTQFDPRIVSLFLKTIASQDSEDDSSSQHFSIDKEKDIGF